MTNFQKIVTKYPLASFFLLSYLLSWWLMITRLGQLAQGVMLAAIIVIALTSGKKGLREFWNRLKHFRAGWMFLIAPLLIVVFIFFDITSKILSGGTFSGFPQMSFVMVAVQLLLFGGEWEEPGWSGYALPTLQKRFAKYKYGILIATLIVGAFRGIWHLPLVIVGAIPWYDALWFSPLIFQPFISWIYNKSGGSVLTVMLFHYSSNLLFAVSPVFADPEKTKYAILYMAFGSLATLTLLWKTKFRLGFPENVLD